MTPVAATIQGRLDPPSGGLDRERLAEIQRARILAGMIGVVNERGLAEATVARVVTRAGVSRRTFYDLFDDREQCFVAALEEAIARLSGRVVAASNAAPGGWADRLRRGLAELLSFLDAERALARLLIVESLRAGDETLRRRQIAIDRLIAVVDAGREEARPKASVPAPLIAEGVVGAVLAVIHARIVSKHSRPLVELLNPLMSVIVAPYLGAAAARRELSRPAIVPPKVTRVRGAVSLGDLPMRLTHRTVSVLLTVAAHPGASNREIGEGSGARDQGQISKLLARLERLGLIQNDTMASARGASNAWTLTQRGEEMRRAFEPELAGG